MKYYGRKNDCGHIQKTGVICKLRILHDNGRGWSRDLRKKEVFKGQSGSGLKHSSLRLNWRKILEKTRSCHKTPYVTRIHALKGLWRDCHKTNLPEFKHKWKVNEDSINIRLDRWPEILAVGVLTPKERWPELQLARESIRFFSLFAAWDASRNVLSGEEQGETDAFAG